MERIQDNMHVFVLLCKFNSLPTNDAYMRHELP